MIYLMKHLFKLSAALFVLAVITSGTYAQTPPRQEKLLNGLKVVMWNIPSGDRVMLRLRIHSGSSFDHQGKEGTMKLLSDSIFPNEPTRAFFEEDLGGNLEVISNYDYIQINASSRPADFLQMIETIATAVSTPTINKETTGIVKERLLKLVAEAESSPEYVADRAVAERLFGNFPYGRPEIGTAASVNSIDFADIRFAYDRFFGADNATLAISGNIDQNLVYRAIRRYFGAWKKSDNLIPPTFRQPEQPDTSLKLIEAPANGQGEVRFAMRGVARNDKNYAATVVLSAILENRLKAKAPAEKQEFAFVRNEARVLPGLITIGLSQINTEINTSQETKEGGSSSPISQIFSEKLSQAEFSAALAQTRLIRNNIDPVALWLDIDTYKLGSVRSEQQAFSALTLANVQRLFDDIKTRPRVSVIVLPASDEKELQEETTGQ